ncbi:L,D-transpeptidase-like protein [Algoriphagus boseongensis]|uniref:L,D-transpeptidase-like protein n=1 Tax=Algoriphagus boseongensis TaxID=1442587 RepID=A0A4R6T9S9_9BACT|nr:murein L,D-transpeptidase catalytic domain family protein [Algoriphagus boseongensis]TDQ18325.1 L,D-transpeptidase-like protein [Algoriphagus boseongensis]
MNFGLYLSILWVLNATDPSSTTNTNSTQLPEDSYEELIEKLSTSNTELPSEQALKAALDGYEKLDEELKNPLLTVIDFSLPSTEKRLWVIDPEKGEILLNSVVAHGRNSGELMAVKFSNRPESYQSSLGFYKTAETYQGKHGYSLRLDGLEKGFNDQARARAIVIHGAEYASEAFAKMTGRLGRSLGCPALPTDISDDVIDLIKDGSLLFIFGNYEEYLANSELAKP